jgi:phospholipase C
MPRTAGRVPLVHDSVTHNPPLRIPSLAVNEPAPQPANDGAPPNGPQVQAEPPLLTRRSALGASAGTAAALALGGVPAWARSKPSRHLRPHRLRPNELPFPDRPMGEPGIPAIEHVVLVMLENHSTDNVLGMLPQVSRVHRRDFDGLPVDRHGTPIATNPDSQGLPVRAFPLPDMCPATGLTQNWNSSHKQFDGGRNDGFVTNVGVSTPMGYMTPAQMPVTYALASHFPISDRYFCSLLGQTLPNRRYYFSGTSSGFVNDDDSSLLASAANGTIFDRLDAAKVSWLVYYDNVPSPFYFPNVRDNPLQVAKCVKNTQFFSDAAAGRLPSVSYVEENFDYQSEENPQDIAYGENFLRRVVAAVMDSPLWSKTALFITYDEHGGFYDHVPPPKAVPPDNIPPNLKLSSSGTFAASFDRYGFRVPLIVVSPWGQPGYVSHKVADHTSILAFLERKWNLPPLTRRDAAAWDLSDMFDTSKRQLARPISLPPAPGINASLAKCRADGENPTTPGLGTTVPDGMRFSRPTR